MGSLRRKPDQDWTETLQWAKGQMNEGWRDIVFQGRLGGGWFKTGEVSGKEYISLTFAHPTLGPRKVYANLGQAYGKEADEFAILWNPQDD